MRWQQGRDRIEEMLHGTPATLQRVQPSREHADRLLRQARAHLATAAKVAGDDPAGAYGLLYDAARKALTAVLENQGLRPTSRGGHLAAYHAVTAQLDPPLGRALRPFDRLRRTRNDAEYPATDAEELTAEQVAEDLPKAAAIADLAMQVLDEMSPF
ncbi:hypothetical protein QOZ88_08110 [Blastococcus sp. BMG 814]|uniref:HEPN domain-containing protein n=1 Tax=Blastococcus carthaginiensis TaxID=3050034 RepID=A0ABT9IAK0_9ACTN|nr:hypothetical protein [Blastococcus carthaginiensis]MDP5182601.1 hypothetical protein [Blastococcus carthaginiensis]